MNGSFLAILIALVSATSVIAQWNVVPCASEDLVKRAAYRASVRAAGPGTPLHVRVPFPVTDTEIVANLTEHFIGIYGEAVGSRFHPIADAMRRGMLNYEIHRVADWTPARCAASGNGGDFYFLVVIRDSVGTEVARASLFETGRFRELGLSEVQWHPIEPLPRVDGRLRSRGIQGDDAQYVSTWGTLACRSLSPCVAVRNKDGIFILQNDVAWLLPMGGAIHSMRTRLRDESDRDRFIAELGVNERFVTLGADAAVVAKRVK